MLRNLQTIGFKNYNLAYTAGADMYRGMAVVVNEATDKAVLATDIAADIYIAYRDTNPDSKLDSAGLVVSEYDAERDLIKADQRLALIKYYAGERFATDRYSGAIAKGDYLTISTANDATKGNWIKASSGTTPYMSAGTQTEGTKTLLKIKVVKA